MANIELLKVSPRKGALLVLDTDQPRQLASQQLLALAYQANGQVKEAVPLLEQVVEIRKTTLAETHPDRLGLEDTLSYYLQQLNFKS
jgi:hypothetical protein